MEDYGVGFGDHCLSGSALQLLLALMLRGRANVTPHLRDLLNIRARTAPNAQVRTHAALGLAWPLSSEGRWLTLLAAAPRWALFGLHLIDKCIFGTAENPA